MEERDEVRWAWESNGQYSVRSAYAAKFVGREVVPYAEFAWGSRQCHFFAWLAMRDRCWILDQLQRRGLPHQDACPLRDQEDETINHILISCVFTRTVWTTVWSAPGKPEWTPSSNDTIVEWCNNFQGSHEECREIRAVAMLVMWELWKHRNAIVFYGASPSLRNIFTRIEAEERAWVRAGLLKGVYICHTLGGLI